MKGKIIPNRSTLLVSKLVTSKIIIIKTSLEVILFLFNKVNNKMNKSNFLKLEDNSAMISN